MKLFDVVTFLMRSAKFYEDIYIQNENFDTSKKPLWIVGIHGTAHTAQGAYSELFEFFKKEKKSLDHIAGIFCPAFAHRFTGTSIEDFAEQLKNQLIEKKISDCILIGHSRGSLIASYFKEFLAQRNNISVHNTIVMGGPFRGSLWARYFPELYKSIDQMKPESEFLQKLNEKIAEHPQDYLCVVAKNDILVKKNSSTIPNAPVLELNTNHIALPMHRLFLEKLKHVTRACIHSLQK